MSLKPKLAEITRAGAESALSEVHVALPARVVAYDAAKQSVDVAPEIKAAYAGEDGARVVEDLPIITAVPVVFPGSGEYTITFPITVGDKVLIVFSESSLDSWLTLGRTADPLDIRRHHISDAIAIPGLRSFARPRSNMPSDHILIGRNGQPSEGVALSDRVTTYLDSLVAYVNTLLVQATSGVVGPGAPAVPSNLGSSTVKVTR